MSWLRRILKRRKARALVHDAIALFLRVVTREHYSEAPVTRCSCGQLMRWTFSHLVLDVARACPSCKRVQKAA